MNANLQVEDPDKPKALPIDLLSEAPSGQASLAQPAGGSSQVLPTQPHPQGRSTSITLLPAVTDPANV